MAKGKTESNVMIVIEATTEEREDEGEQSRKAYAIYRTRIIDLMND